jgi:hypothetical protein
MKRPHGEWPVSGSIAFLFGLIVVACGVLGGLYFLFRHAKSNHDKLTRQRPPLPNWK